jgi:hypothetical protein
MTGRRSRQGGSGATWARDAWCYTRYLWSIRSYSEGFPKTTFTKKPSNITHCRACSYTEPQVGIEPTTARLRSRRSGGHGRIQRCGSSSEENLTFNLFNSWRKSERRRRGFHSVLPACAGRNRPPNSPLLGAPIAKRASWLPNGCYHGMTVQHGGKTLVMAII